MKTIIYIHICCINNYKELVLEHLEKIKESGLYDVVDEIRFCVLGQIDETLIKDKIKLWAYSNDNSLYEKFTINTIRNDCMKEDMNVLYLHTKGVTKPNNKMVKSWVDYLCYFNIGQYKKCLELLETNDTVGVNLQDIHWQQLHYSGNFWWSKSQYIKKLGVCPNQHYNDPEFWLTKDRVGKYISLWHSNCPHYSAIYPPENYVNKPIHPYTLI